MVANSRQDGLPGKMRVVALEAGLLAENNLQLYCIFQSLVGSESYKPVRVLGQDLPFGLPSAPGESSMIRPKWSQLWGQADLDSSWLCDFGESHLTVPQSPHQANRVGGKIN